MTLLQVMKKKRRRIIGLMSGTSADSIDAALVTVTGSGFKTRYAVDSFISFKYPRGYREYVLANSQPGSSSVDELCRLNVLAAEFFADAARAVAKRARIPLSAVDVIGSHGQTVHHLPAAKKMFGKQVRSTLQLGDPSAIAKLTGVITVGNFRAGDIALDGQGAPLVPFFDAITFRSRTKNRLLVNIGGIANVTLLPKNCSLADVRAFDTGPGNMMIDAVMTELYGKQYDAGGAVAARGDILVDIIRRALRLSYFKTPPPKSTGRELFGTALVTDLLKSAHGARREDIIASITEITPLTIYQQFLLYLRHICSVDEVIVSGGGSLNRTIMDGLARYFASAEVLTSDDVGLSSDAKEAVCFAILANETISGNPANLPGVTGASRATVLGSINLP
jgi:anhydro-N-acetylmuramic acid kinase